MNSLYTKPHQPIFASEAEGHTAPRRQHEAGLSHAASIQVDEHDHDDGLVHGHNWAATTYSR